MIAGKSWWLLSLLALATCQEIEYESRNYPRLGRTEVSEVDAQGATFTGHILTLGNSPIEEHGFEWNYERVYLGGTSTVGQFSARAHYAIQDGVQYAVRCFAVSNGVTIYGDRVDFVGQGSESAVIESFEPLVATWLDTVRLHGNNFSIQSSIVDFGGVVTTVIGGNDTLLVVRVPVSLSDTSTLVTYRFDNKATSTGSKFSLTKPLIESIEPTSGTLGTKITITGKHFHPSNNVVRMADQSIGISSTSTTLLKATVSGTGLIVGSQVITVQSGSYQVEAPVPFNLIGPEITSISPEFVTFDETFTITGSNLGGGIPTVEVGGISAQVLAASATSISATVPLTLNEAENSVEVTVNGLTTISPTSLKVKAPVITTILPNNSVYPHTVVSVAGSFFHPTTNQLQLNGIDYSVTTSSASQLYFILPTSLYDHDVKARVVTVGQASEEATLTAPLIRRQGIDEGEEAKSEAFGFSLFGMGYLVIGMSGAFPAREVWTFDPVGNFWQRLSDFPGQARTRGVGMTAGGKAYYGLGVSNETGEFLMDWWEFNPSNNNWTAKTSAPFFADPNTPRIPAVDGKGLFFSLPAYDLGLMMNRREFWSYDPSANAWIQKATPSSTYFHENQFERSCSFGLGARAYFFIDVAQEAWQYDIPTNQWTSLSYNLPGGNQFDQGVTDFELGSRGYLLSSASLMTYDPNTNDWTFLSEPQFEAWYGGEAANFSIGSAAYWGFGVYNAYSNDLELRNTLWKFDPAF